MVRRSVVAALCVTLLFLTACVSQEPVDVNRVAANKQTLEKCRDDWPCIGGFVKFKDDFRIYRLVRDCGPMACAPYVAGLITLSFFDDGLLNHVEYIRLPDDKEWDKTAIAYAKQFVERREKK